jgi:rhodanese-related sulfurtransferase
MMTVTPQELMFWTESSKPFTLVDVREGFERELFSLGGLHIPLGEIHLRWQELPADTPLVFYCAKGIRSGIAMQRLESAGLGPMYNLTGGVAAWQDAGGAV